jgi:hypothetical protein
MTNPKAEQVADEIELDVLRNNLKDAQLSDLGNQLNQAFRHIRRTKIVLLYVLGDLVIDPKWGATPTLPPFIYDTLKLQLDDLEGYLPDPKTIAAPGCPVIVDGDTLENCGDPLSGLGIWCEEHQRQVDTGEITK